MAGGQVISTGRLNDKGSLEDYGMAPESGKETGHSGGGKDSVESFTDDLIREFLTEASQSIKSAGGGKGGMAALLEAIMASSSGPSRASMLDSMLERLLLAQMFASQLADAIAPALAESLTPEIMKSLEQYTTNGSSRKEPAAATRGRRTETK
jgi:hypothetical protein